MGGRSRVALDDSHLHGRLVSDREACQLQPAGAEFIRVFVCSGEIGPCIPALGGQGGQGWSVNEYTASVQ